jgi:hypothetical protein
MIALTAAAVGACQPAEMGPSSNAPATAGTVQADSLGENLDTDLTQWWYYFGKSPADVASLLTANGARLVGIQVESTSPLLFTVTMVKNSGSYNKAWWWNYAMTEPQVNTWIASHGARLDALAPYVVGGITYYAAVAISNSGSDAKDWWWKPQVAASSINSLTHDYGARLVDMRQYTLDNQIFYSIVMVSNSGSDGTAWWWNINQTPAQIASQLQQNGAYLVSLEPANADGTLFNFVMYHNPGVAWWWYTNVGQNNAGALAGDNGARIFDLKSYFVNGTRYFTAIMLQDGAPTTPKLVNTDYTTTQFGGETYVCMSGSGFTPGAEAYYTFNGIPGRTAPITEISGVAANGTFGTSQLVEPPGIECSQAQLFGTVTVTIQDGNVNTIGSGRTLTTTLPAEAFCANHSPHTGASCP